MAVDMGDHMALLSAHHTYAEESDFKRPHPPYIGRDIWSDRWLACGWRWVWRSCGVCA